jgi:hypothetical protein
VHRLPAQAFQNHQLQRAGEEITVVGLLLHEPPS